jgi:hypothetical protein
MKRYYFILAVLIIFIGCTKEGIIGPQGPEGPEGDPGATGSGTGGGGGIVNIRSVITESPAIFSWVEHAGGATSKSYILKWKVPDHTHVADEFVLNAGFKDEETNSKLLIYVSEGNGNDSHSWRQLPFTDAGFGNMTTYRYEVKVNGDVVLVSVFADRSTAFGPTTQLPSIDLNAIKVIALPNGEGFVDQFISF